MHPPFMRLMTDKPRLLVTGLSGLIGSRVAGLLQKRLELINLDITEGIDITNRKKLIEAVGRHQGANVLAHLAAFTDVSRAHGQTGDKSGPCYKINVTGTENVVKACEEFGLHIIHVSTDFVFDAEKPAKSGPYTEQDHPKPIEWYGKTKLMAEDAVRKAKNWTIIRIAYPYVAGPAPRSDLVQNIYSRLVEGLEVQLFTDQVITPTFADDVAQGIGLLARLRPARELFHLVGSSSMTPFDLGLKIARAFRFDQSLVRPSLLADYKKKDPRPRHKRLHLSNAKWTAFAVRHGLHRPMTIDEGLARVVKAQPLPVKSERSKTE